ncbi:MAG TPA: phospholipase D family protein [Caldimonas sp.]|jgi:putative cardiolipin synthase|nr:phospholipase D family protein [Caldimonas sp.]HEX2540431.1 phospholipase D family protein [Caldimonas sp.]
MPQIRDATSSGMSRLWIWLGCAGAAGAALEAGWRAVVLAVAVSLGGCAALPTQVARPPSLALTDVADTSLARAAAASMSAARPGESGFRLLPGGREAFEARTALIRRAERSIDVQYYLVASDDTGLAFLRELRDAGRRGVRVHVLIDDLYATGQDALLAALAANPNVEVRLFNPLPARSGGMTRRVALSLHEFSRINRRMHNKLLIADGSFAVTGGRNIADEYFDRSEKANFIDMDVLSAGPVVGEMAALFDRFWNADAAYPVASLARPAAVAAAFDAHAAPAAASDDPDRSGGRTLDAELAAGGVDLVTAAVELLADAPSKSDAAAPPSPTVADAHLDLVRSARSSVQLASPYFIPGAKGMKALAEVRARDVEVSVLTNSLATTDEPLVHLGYARYRTALLNAGVSLHELIGGVAPPGSHSVLGAGSGRGGSFGRLHSKLTVVDGERLFVGSLNIDPRSALFNTESGLVIHSAELCAEASRFLDSGRREGSYRVQLSGPERRLRWHAAAGEAYRELAAEPAVESRGGVGLRVLARLVDEAML